MSWIGSTASDWGWEQRIGAIVAGIGPFVVCLVRHQREMSPCMMSCAFGYCGGYFCMGLDTGYMSEARIGILMVHIVHHEEKKLV